MSVSSTITRLLPSGNLLAPTVFASRHRLLVSVLLGHLPVIYVLGLIRGYDPLTTALELLPALACVGLASLGGRTSPALMRARAVAVTAGLSWTSIVLVHVSGGQIEAHFHFFIVLGFIALYQDWLPFLWYVGFTALSHGLGSLLAPGLVFDHASGQANPWAWSAVHASGVALLSIGLVIFWSNTESEQKRATSLATELSARDLERARLDIQQRQTQNQLLLNLARRNQSLVQRQLDTIEGLESDEQRPEVLDRLFTLDHMTTRMRRNAESLLVLSGAEPARIWREPIPLADMLRAGIGEVEDYQRVDLTLTEDARIEGRSAADLSHLFAELVENATTCSPPSTRVTVSAQVTVSGDVVVVVRDRGIGMDAATLAEARALLLSGLEESQEDGRALTPGDARLGLQVVGRLARRHGMGVEIDAGPGGTTAQVTIPAQLVVDEPVQVQPALPEHRLPSQGVPGQATPSWTPPVPAAARVEAPLAPVPAFASVSGPAERPGGQHAAVPASPLSSFAALTSRRDELPGHTHQDVVDRVDEGSVHESSLDGAVGVVGGGDGLPDLPRRSRQDDVAVAAPVDLWGPTGGGTA